MTCRPHIWFHVPEVEAGTIVDLSECLSIAKIQATGLQLYRGKDNYLELGFATETDRNNVYKRIMERLL